MKDSLWSKIKPHLTIENFKNSLIIILLCIGATFGYNLWKNNEENSRLYRELIGQKQKYEQITKNLAKLEIQYKEQKDLAAQYKKDFSEYKKSSDQRIKILSNATYLIRERARKEKRSDLVYEGKRIKYVFNELRFKDGPPIGYVMIFDNGKVVSKIYNHVIDVKTAVLRDEDSGKYEVLSKADFILRSGHLKPDGKNWFGVRHPLEINGGTATIDPTEKNPARSRFHLWAPRLSGGFNLMATQEDGIFARPTLGVSLAGYGPSKRDLDYKFAHIGVGFSQDTFDLNLVPVYYRPFRETLPNTYIGPGVSLSNEGTNYFLGINFNF